MLRLITLHEAQSELNNSSQNRLIIQRDITYESECGL
jgi:hypothetical protein